MLTSELASSVEYWRMVARREQDQAGRFSEESAWKRRLEQADIVCRGNKKEPSRAKILNAVYERLPAGISCKDKGKELVSTLA